MKNVPPTDGAGGDVPLGDRILSTKLVCQKLGVARSTLDAWVKQGHFPGSFKLGPGRVGWLESTVDDWIKARAAERKGQGRGED